MPNDRDNEIRCSFCGKTQDEVTRLVEGPGVYICDNCIEFCNALLSDDEEGRTKKRKSWMNTLSGRTRLKKRLPLRCITTISAFLRTSLPMLSLTKATF